LVSRLLALGVDAVLVGTAVAVVGAGGPALWHTLTGEVPEWLRLCASVVAGAVPVLYFWLAWWLLGRSLGGLLLGSVVLRADYRRMRVLHAAARAFLGLLFAPVWLAGMLLILVEPRRRALHDVLLGTVVVRPVHDPVDHPPLAVDRAAPS
ncbi:RDD family protein, partial [Actinospica durhamensis]